MAQDLFVAIEGAQAEAIQGGSNNGSSSVFSFITQITATPNSFLSSTILTTARGTFTKLFSFSFMPTEKAYTTSV